MLPPVQKYQNTVLRSMGVQAQGRATPKSKHVFQSPYSSHEMPQLLRSAKTQLFQTTLRQAELEAEKPRVQNFWEAYIARSDQFLNAVKKHREAMPRLSGRRQVILELYDQRIRLEEDYQVRLKQCKNKEVYEETERFVAMLAGQPFLCQGEYLPVVRQLLKSVERAAPEKPSKAPNVFETPNLPLYSPQIMRTKEKNAAEEHEFAQQSREFNILRDKFLDLLDLQLNAARQQEHYSSDRYARYFEIRLCNLATPGIADEEIKDEKDMKTVLSRLYNATMEMQTQQASVYANERLVHFDAVMETLRLFFESKGELRMRADLVRILFNYVTVYVCYEEKDGEIIEAMRSDLVRECQRRLDALPASRLSQAEYTRIQNLERAKIQQLINARSIRQLLAVDKTYEETQTLLSAVK